MDMLSIMMIFCVELVGLCCAAGVLQLLGLT